MILKGIFFLSSLLRLEHISIYIHNLLKQNKREQFWSPGTMGLFANIDNNENRSSSLTYLSFFVWSSAPELPSISVPDALESQPLVSCISDFIVWVLTNPFLFWTFHVHIRLLGGWAFVQFLATSVEQSRSSFGCWCWQFSECLLKFINKMLLIFVADF